MKRLKAGAFAAALCLISMTSAETLAQSGSEPIKMSPVVVEEKSLAGSGFGFKARFRYHMIWSGVKELVIVTVEPSSAARKAGLMVGEKIVCIWDTPVEGLKISELEALFKRPSQNGAIPLVIAAKDSGQQRSIELRFH
jgi:C-terminal processing protease CtpA/Prc